MADRRGATADQYGTVRTGKGRRRPRLASTPIGGARGNSKLERWSDHDGEDGTGRGGGEPRGCPAAERGCLGQERRGGDPGTPAAPEHAAGHWPQWCGPGRDGVSKETGLLKEWPEKGPPLAWQVTGLGDGVGSVAVEGSGRVFVLGKSGDDEQSPHCPGGVHRQKLGAVPVGPAVKGENSLMRLVSQRTPTVDGDRVSPWAAHGDLVCLAVKTASTSGASNYPKEFAGPTGGTTATAAGGR